MTNFQSHTLKVWTRRITSIAVCTHRSGAAGVPGCYSLASLIQNKNDNRFKGLSGLGFGVIESAHAGFLSFFGFAKIRFLSHLHKFFFSRFHLQKYNCCAQLICARVYTSHTSLQFFPLQCL